MKVHCDEGVATHIDLPSRAQASARTSAKRVGRGASIGQPSEPRNRCDPGCRRRSLIRKAKWTGALTRAPRPTRRGLRPWHVWTLLAREPGDLWIGHRPYWVRVVRGGKVRSRSRRCTILRSQTLRQSSREADEQSRATGCGASGAKAGEDQGERGSAKHAPDTEPERA